MNVVECDSELELFGVELFGVRIRGYSQPQGKELEVMQLQLL